MPDTFDTTKLQPIQESGNEAQDILMYVYHALEAKGYAFVSAAIEMVPQNYVKLTNEEDIKNMTRMIELMEDNDDIQNVYHNWDQE